MTNLIRAEEGALAQTGSRNLRVIGLHDYVKVQYSTCFHDFIFHPGL